MVFNSVFKRYIFPSKYEALAVEESKPVLLHKFDTGIKPKETSNQPRVALYAIGALFLANLLQALALLRGSGTAQHMPPYYPKFPLETWTINRNITWEEISNPQSDTLWNTGVPGITGWVQIENARGNGLPRGIPSLGESEVYITTWGHQHHCLKILRKEFSKLLTGDSILVESAEHGAHNEIAGGQLHHLMHCFDYLRQTISCQSDLTLEGLGAESNETYFDIDGYGVEHQCKSQRDVESWLLSHAPVEEVYRDFDL
ncbi:hypothetical protein V8C37DRAFT_397146 [Trichoderma ceciliae]